MRRLPLLLLLVGIASPVFPAKIVGVRKVTVEQLEKFLVSTHRLPDAKAAQQIYQLELTERMSAVRLARAEADLPGPASRKALFAVSDVGAFLDLPAADLSAASAPDSTALKLLLAKTVDYANRTISRLPNFFATRDTTRFEAMQPVKSLSGMRPIGFEFLHEVGASSAEVLYRNGQESVNVEGSNRDRHVSVPPQLNSIGEFGPVLAVTLRDAAKGKMFWGHWEQGVAGPIAVFHYSVPEAASHYAVAFPGVYGETIHHPAYHGEIAVNPADGSILRLTIVADLKPDDPVAVANILVDYGPVEIGGKSYICPIKSVALARFPDTGTYQSYRISLSLTGFLKTQVNDTRFKQYHLFRAEMRILSGDAPVPDASPSPSVPAAIPAH